MNDHYIITKPLRTENKKFFLKSLLETCCKNITKKQIFSGSILLITLLLTVSCFREKEATQFKTLFSFDIGFSHTELGLVNEIFFNEHNNINFYYSNGFHFISDRMNNKILKVSESGKTMLTIFNGNNYPNLKTLSETTGMNSDDVDLNYLILYKEFELISPGLISADFEKNIYVINSNPEYKKLNKNIIEEKIILKFDTNGKLIYKLGKEGVNGNPFGFISKMINDKNNNLIIIERSSEGFMVYKFSPDGELQKKSEITLKTIPLLKSEINHIISFVDITPGYNEDEIYITCQFADKQPTMSLEVYSIEYEKIYLYNLSENKVEKMILKINPEYEDITRYRNNPAVMEMYGDKTSVEKPYQSLIGIDIFNNIYLSQKEIPLESITANNHYIFQYLSNGKMHKTKFISFPRDSLYVKNFHITEEGLILTYIVKEDKVIFAKVK